jgi:hypothetical protein
MGAGASTNEETDLEIFKAMTTKYEEVTLHSHSHTISSRLHTRSHHELAHSLVLNVLMCTPSLSGTS